MEIQGFNILENMGDNPVASVWKARQLSLDRLVVIKVLKHKLITRPGETHPILKEAGLAAKLKHPNLVPIYDVARDGMKYYFVMEYVQGRTIRQIIESTKDTFTIKSALSVASQVAEALNAAWESAQLTHRAVNPDNVFLDENNGVKIADLGLPKAVDAAYLSHLVKSPSVRNGLFYISPEQARGSATVDTRTDMYGLGGTLYFMLTGRHPFAGLPAGDILDKHISGRLPHPTDINKSVPIEVGRFIASLMMKDPSERPASWAEIFREIQRINPKTRKGRKIVAKKDAQPEHPRGSTISPPSEPAAPAAQKLKLRVQRTEPSPTASSPAEPELHPGIRLGIWAAIFLFWYITTSIQLSLPPLPRVRTVSPPPSAATMVRPAPEVPKTAARPPDKPAQAPSQERPSPPPAQDQQPPPAENHDSENLEGFRRSIAQHVLAGEIETALAMIDTEMDYPHGDAFTREMDAIRSILLDASRASDVLSAALQNRIGREISVRDGTSIRRLVLRSVNGQTVSGEIMEQQGRVMVGKPATVPIAQIDSAEIRRLTGGSSSSPGLAVFYMVLSMKRGDMDAARRYASQCGPIAPVLGELLQDRSATATEQ